MSSNPYKPLNPAQLIESAKDEPIGYLVDGLLPIGSLNMLAGKPKSGKSTLVRQLAACVAKGDDFLGRSTTKGDVLYFASEEIGAHLAEHFGLLGISKAEDGVHTVLRRPGINFVSRLVETLKIMPDVRLVIVDPLVNFLPGVDMDNYGMIAPALADMVEGQLRTVYLFWWFTIQRSVIPQRQEIPFSGPAPLSERCAQVSFCLARWGTPGRLKVLSDTERGWSIPNLSLTPLLAASAWVLRPKQCNSVGPHRREKTASAVSFSTHH
jgi:AAA domain